MNEQAPLARIRVVELAHWVAGPAVGGVLADWGADVIKVEAGHGDAMRHLFPKPSDSKSDHSPMFSAINRGKRSVGLDLATSEGRSGLDRLLDDADVFVTNLRPGALERLQLGRTEMAARYPRLVFCSLTAYGWEGPDREAAGYDLAGFFARSGVLHQLTPPGTAPAPFSSGLGDMFTAMSAVAGILAALTERHHTGRGRFVEASLLRTGMWALAGEMSMAANGKAPKPVANRDDNTTPLFNLYRTADERWFVLVGVEADRHRPNVLAAIGRPELAHDRRFIDTRSIMNNRREFIAILDGCFALRTLARWREIFATHDVWWGPVQTPLEVGADPQAAAAGAWVQLANEAGRSVEAPIRFDGLTRSVVPDAPLVGQHTAEVLAELAARTGRAGEPDV